MKNYLGILYLTYDGITDPLGQSQILPYLFGLSKNNNYKICPERLNLHCHGICENIESTKDYNERFIYFKYSLRRLYRYIWS